MFDDTINNMETQNRNVYSTKTIEMQATKAVDEILKQGVIGQKSL